MEQEVEDLDQWDSPEEYIFDHKSVYLNYARSIGEMIIVFSDLEHAINKVLVESIWEGSDDGYLYIRSSRMIEKIEMLKNIGLRNISFRINEENPDYFNFEEQEWRALIGQIKSVNTFRNKIAHANWMTLKDDGFVRTKIQHGEDGLVTFVNVKVTRAVIREYIRKSKRCANVLYEKAVL